MNQINFQNSAIIDGELYVDMDGNQRIMDFVPTYGAVMKPFVADFKVQVMHDGNIYMTERKRRVRNKPMFREDNSSLTLGRDGRFYFIFAMSEQKLHELPTQLRLQAARIAQKVEDKYFND